MAPTPPNHVSSSTTPLRKDPSSSPSSSPSHTTLYDLPPPSPNTYPRHTWRGVHEPPTSAEPVSVPPPTSLPTLPPPPPTLPSGMSVGSGGGGGVRELDVVVVGDGEEGSPKSRGSYHKPLHGFHGIQGGEEEGVSDEAERSVGVREDRRLREGGAGRDTSAGGGGGDGGEDQDDALGVSNALSVCCSILLYSCVSLGIVFLNRKIFSDSFQFPVFVSWLQQVVGLGAFQLLSILSSNFKAFSCLRDLFPRVTLERSKLRAIAPLSMAFVGMIGFSNTCLKYVQVSTYQVARALTLLFNLILSKLILKTYISRNSAVACGVVMSGFVVGSMDPETLSMIGVVTGIVSSVFQAFYMVQIKRSLIYLNNDQNVLLCYNLFMSAIMFFPMIFIAGEGGFIYELPISPSDERLWVVWSLLISSGMLGILLTMATYWCVRVTSPVTFNVVGYAKACLQSLGGIVLLGDLVTAKSLSGILLTLVGSFYYSHVKMTEKPAAATQPTDTTTAGNLRSGGDASAGGRVVSEDKKRWQTGPGNNSEMQPMVVVQNFQKANE
eukprot:GHVQ01007648.1.p1 GENE.GHVQ01007648.1~~GHVQ01007648.1.p1  ORF type:complete len:551 (-),score=109.81 GHVQ01007648.1:361-2013(-)